MNVHMSTGVDNPLFKPGGTHNNRMSCLVRSAIQTHIDSCQEGGVQFLVVVPRVSVGSLRSPKTGRDHNITPRPVKGSSG